jgi:hypothetical protein
MDVAVDSDGNMYVADWNNARLDKFSPSGTFLWSAPTGFQETTNVVIGADGLIYASGMNSHQIRKFDSSGNSLGSFQGIGDPMVYSGIMDMAPRPSGGLYFTMYHELDGMDASGSLTGTLAGNFGFFPYIASDQFGNVYVSDSASHAITKLSPTGQVLAKLDAASWGGPSDGSSVGAIAATTDGLVFVIDGNQIVRIDTNTPTAALSASSDLLLTGQQVTLAASGSTAPLSSITKYEWDLDGDGQFDTDTGTAATVKTSFDRPGVYTLHVRVTASSGKTATSSVVEDVRPAPPSGVVGVSIDSGLIATSDQNVTLDLVWPAGATSAMISNDGGFGPAGSTETVPLTPTVPWTLESSGPERLPKTVYVRFLGAGSDLTPYTDDIVLDQTVPLIDSAELTHGQGSQGRQNTVMLRATPSVQPLAGDLVSGVANGQWARHNTAMRPAAPTVQLSASDLISGVTTVQVTDGSQVASTDLVAANTLGEYTVNQAIPVGLAAPSMVRVRNAAGTWSGWTALTGVPVRCVVPRLKGKTLGRARTLLRRARCALGVVHKPARTHRVLKVKSQSPRPGSSYSAGRRVSLTLT